MTEPNRVYEFQKLVQVSRFWLSAKDDVDSIFRPLTIPSTCACPAPAFTLVRNRTLLHITRLDLHLTLPLGTYYTLFGVGMAGVVYGAYGLIRVRRILTYSGNSMLTVPYAIIGQEDRVKSNVSLDNTSHFLLPLDGTILVP